jgi:hypothetical protein
MPRDKAYLRDNEFVKKANAVEHITQAEYDFRVAEIERCKADPIYFAENYYEIVSIDKGKHIIRMYDKQKQLIQMMHKENRVICMASRQTGKCVCSSTRVIIRNKKINKVWYTDPEEFSKRFLKKPEHDGKFIERYDVDGYEIVTDSGFVDVVALHKTIPFVKYELRAGRHRLECADDHIVFRQDYEEVFVKDLRPGDLIRSDTGIDVVERVECLGVEENMYDFELSDKSDHRYYTNGILSHNTTSYCIFALWRTLFAEDQKVLICAQTMKNAMDFLGNIRLAYENIPFWLKPGCLEYNKKKIVFGNRSQIESNVTSPAVRGSTGGILILDEFAIIENHIVDEFWKAVYPTVSSSKNSKVIIVSTPKGVGNLYYQIYKGAEDDPGGEWKNFRIDWYDVPGRDEVWKQQTINSMCKGDLTAWNQEYGNCCGPDTIVHTRNRGLHSLITMSELYDSFDFCGSGSEFISNEYGYLVESPEGFVGFGKIRRTRNILYEVACSDGTRLEVTWHHMFNVGGVDVELSNLAVGCLLDTKHGSTYISSIEIVGESWVYDLCDVGTKSLYYTNGIVSHNCFLGSSQTLIPAEALDRLGATITPWKDMELITKYNSITTKYVFRMWKPPVKFHSYVMGVDTSEGVGGDYSIALVVDVTNPMRPEIVALFRDNFTPPSLHALIVVKLGEMYNTAALAIECNSLGFGVVETIFNTYEYSNLLNIRKPGSMSHGIYSNHVVKLNACMWIRDYLSCEDVRMSLNDTVTMGELRTFEKSNSVVVSMFKALGGFKDDCAMALTWALFALHESNVEKVFSVNEWHVTKTNIKIPIGVMSYHSDYWSVDAGEKRNDAAYINGSRVSMLDDGGGAHETVNMGFMDF